MVHQLVSNIFTRPPTNLLFFSTIFVKNECIEKETQTNYTRFIFYTSKQKGINFTLETGSYSHSGDAGTMTFFQTKFAFYVHFVLFFGVTKIPQKKSREESFSTIRLVLCHKLGKTGGRVFLCGFSLSIHNTSLPVILSAVPLMFHTSFQ